MYFFVLTISVLIFAQVPENLPQPAKFESTVDFDVNPYGSLNFSILLLSLPGSNTYTYNFNLSYTR